MKGRIWLLGGYGVGNLGDDLLAHVTQLTIREAGHEALVIAGDSYSFERDAPLARRKLMHLLERGDRLLIAGGGLLGQTFGLRYTAYYASLAAMARVRGAEVHLLGLGVEPFTSSWGRMLMRGLLQASTTISVRDVTSKKIAEEYTRRSVNIVPDLGWLSASQSRSTSRTVVGAKAPIALTIAAESRETVEHRLNALFGIVDKLLKHDPAVEFMGIPMQTSPIKSLDDASAIARLAASLAPGVVRVESPRNYIEVRDLLSQARGLIGYRLHSLILARTVGVPCIAISRSHKVSEAFRDDTGCILVDEIMADPREIAKVAYHRMSGERCNVSDIDGRMELARAAVLRAIT